MVKCNVHSNYKSCFPSCQSCKIEEVPGYTQKQCLNLKYYPQNPFPRVLGQKLSIEDKG